MLVVLLKSFSIFIGVTLSNSVHRCRAGGRALPAPPPVCMALLPRGREGRQHPALQAPSFPFHFLFTAKQRIGIFNALIFFFSRNGPILFCISPLGCAEGPTMLSGDIVCQKLPRESSLLCCIPNCLYGSSALSQQLLKEAVSCGYDVMNRPVGKCVGVKQIAALENIQAVWECHSALFSIGKL